MYIDMTFENYGSFNVTLESTKGSRVTFSDKNGMRDCIDFIKHHMYDPRIDKAYIIDSETGEIVAIVDKGKGKDNG